MRLTIRITRTTISFTAPNTVIEGQTDFEQYSMKTGISVAANLREALAQCRLLQVQPQTMATSGQGGTSQYHPIFDQVRVYVDTPLLLIPAEEFDESAVPLLYRHVNTGYQNDDVLATPINGTNTMAAFALDKDMRFVLTERFISVQFLPLLSPVLAEFSRLACGGFQEKLFCYFHDKRVDVCAFRKSHIRFCSSFDATSAADSAYFILNTWKQLAMRPTDVLCISGNIMGHEALIKQLEQFIKNIRHINI